MLLILSAQSDLNALTKTLNAVWLCILCPDDITWAPADIQYFNRLSIQLGNLCYVLRTDI